MAANDSVKFKVYGPGYQTLSTTFPGGISWTLGYCVPIYDPAFDVRSTGYIHVSNVDFLKENGLTHLEWWDQYETVDTLAAKVSAFDGEKLWLRGTFDPTGQYIRSNGYQVTGNLYNEATGLFDQSRLVENILPIHCWKVKPYIPINVTAATGSATAGTYEAVIPSDAGDFVFNKMAVFLKKLDANGQETGEIMFFGMVYSNVNLLKRFYGYGSVVNMVLKLNVVVRSNLTSYDDYVFFSDGYWKAIGDATIGTDNNTVSGSSDPTYFNLFRKARHTTIFDGDYAPGHWNQLFLTQWRPGLLMSPDTFTGFGILTTSFAEDVGYHHFLGTSYDPGEYGDQTPRATTYFSPFYADKGGRDTSGITTNVVFGRAHKFDLPATFFREVGGGGNFIFDLLSGQSSNGAAPSITIYGNTGIFPLSNAIFGAGHTVGGFGNFVSGYGGAANDDTYYGSITHGWFNSNFGQGNRIGQYGAPGGPGQTDKYDFESKYTTSFGLTNEAVLSDFSMLVGHCNKTTSSFAMLVGSKNDLLGNAWIDLGQGLVGAQQHYEAPELPAWNVTQNWTPVNEGAFIFGHMNQMFSWRNRDSGANYWSTTSWYDNFVFGYRNRVGLYGNPTYASFFGGEELSVNQTGHSMVYGYRSTVEYAYKTMALLHNKSSSSSHQFGLGVMNNAYGQNWCSVGMVYDSPTNVAYSNAVSSYSGGMNPKSYVGLSGGYFSSGMLRNYPVFGSNHIKTSEQPYVYQARIIDGGNGGGSSAFFYGSALNVDGYASTLGNYGCWSRIAKRAIETPTTLGAVDFGGGQGTIHYLHNVSSPNNPMYVMSNGSTMPEASVPDNAVYVKESAMPTFYGDWDSGIQGLTNGRQLYMYLSLSHVSKSTGISIFQGDLYRVSAISTTTINIGGVSYRRILLADSRTNIPVTHIRMGDTSFYVRFIQRVAAFVEVQPEGLELLLQDDNRMVTQMWTRNPSSTACLATDQPYNLYNTNSISTSNLVTMSTFFNSIGSSAGYIGTSVLNYASNCHFVVDSSFLNNIASSRVHGRDIHLYPNSGSASAKYHLATPMAATELGERWQFQTEWDSEVYNRFGQYESIYTDVMGSNIIARYAVQGNGQGHGAYNRWFGHKLYIGRDFYDGSLGTTGIMFSDIFGLDISVLNRTSSANSGIAGFCYANHNIFARGIHLWVTRSDQFVMGKLNKGSIYNVFEFGFGDYAYNDESWWYRKNAISIGYLHKGGAYYTPEDYSLEGNGYAAADMAFKVDCGIILVGDEDDATKRGIVVKMFNAYAGQVAPMVGLTPARFSRTIQAGDPIVLIPYGTPLTTDLLNVPDTGYAAGHDTNCLAVCLPSLSPTGMSENLLQVYGSNKVVGVALSAPVNGQVPVAFGGGPITIEPQVLNEVAGGPNWIDELPDNIRVISKAVVTSGVAPNIITRTSYKVFLT